MEKAACEKDKPVNFPVRAGEFRKILKPNRHIFSNRIYSTHLDRHRPCPTTLENNPVQTTSLKSTSMYTLEPPKKNVELPQKTLDIPKLNLSADSKDGYTQTSKTILQLVLMQGDGLSPDSLNGSPPNKLSPKVENPVNEDPALPEGSTMEYKKYLSFSRKAAINQFFEACQSPNGYKSPNPERGENYPRQSLIETFLAKSRNRDHSQHSSEKTYVIQEGSGSSSDENKSKFLQQTSPLRHLIKNDPNPLKSKSCVESYHPSYVSDFHKEELKLPIENRFKVKKVRNKLTKDETKGVKYFCNTALSEVEEKQEDVESCSETDSSNQSPRRFQQNKRSNSFMSPTIASEKKNQLKDIKRVTGLISPTRRGRSSSPKVTNIVEKLSPRHGIKIPYIDQSDQEIPVHDHDAALSNESRYSPKGKHRGNVCQTTKMINSIVSKRARETGKLITPLVNKPVFEEDLLRIDELSLDITTSEGNLTGSVRVCSTTSNTSLDDAVASAISKLKDQDWNTALKGLAEITELCRLLDTDLLFAHMTAVNQRLIELLRSPRSHVCRTACQAAGHLFESMKDTRRPEFDDIVNLLLFKTADANKFIRQDANLSLDCMVTHINTFHAVRTLCAKGPTHKNYLVRSATARLLVCAVVIAGANSILNPVNNEHTRKRIMVQMAKFIQDKNLETRKYGERLYKVLSKEPTFDMYLRKYFDREEVAQLKKSLRLDRKK